MKMQLDIIQPEQTVLVIDRDEDIRAVIVDLLSGRGLEIELARNAAEGVQRLQDPAPRVVLCHLDLLREDEGLLLRRMRALAPRPHVVAMSASGLRAGRDEVDGNLAKPFTRRQLLAALSPVTSSAGARRRGPREPSRAGHRC